MERGEKFPDVFFPGGSGKFEWRLTAAFFGGAIHLDISYTGDVVIIVGGLMASERAAISRGIIDKAPR